MSDLMVLVSRQNLEHWERMCSDNPASVALMISHALSSEGSTEFFDAALAREAALQRDRDNWKLKACEAAEREAALREELATLRSENERLDRESQNLSSQLGSCDRERRALREELDGIRVLACCENRVNLAQRLTAAEQRNAKMEDLLRDMRRLPQKRCAAFIVDIIDILDAKPTESGASDKCASDGGTCGLGGHCGECPHIESGASE